MTLKAKYQLMTDLGVIDGSETSFEEFKKAYKTPAGLLGFVSSMAVDNSMKSLEELIYCLLKENK